MSSPERRRLSLRLATLALCTALGTAAAAEEGSTATLPPGSRLTPEQVEHAVELVAADPDLGGKRSERTLRLIKRPDKDAPETKPHESPNIPWLLEAVEWIASGGRWLVFLLGAAALGLCIVHARRWILAQAEASAVANAVPPTHVRDLDIRPESLPLDIAAAARDLWLAGDQRAALSLLYRGALSRLVHAYQVPIGAASTEGECLRLVSSRVPPPAAAFFGRLVAAWLLAVYGARMPESAQVLALCGDFDSHWPAAGIA